MKRMMSLLISTLLVAAVPALAMGASLTALEIMQRVDARDDGDNMTSDRTMVLIDKNGHKRTRIMKSFTKDKGEDTLKLMFFTAPADVRDTGFLTWDYREGARDDDQWLWLPELKKVKRIASADKSGAFMGSDFSYADMTNRVVEEWRYKLLKTDAVRGTPCWLIQAVPVDETVQDRYGYKKSILFIRQDIFMMCRAVHWLDEGNNIKYVDLPDIQRIDGIWTALAINAKTTRGGKTLHRTVFRMQNVKYGQAIEETMFTTRQLEKGM
jgi:hypothetical protein